MKKVICVAGKNSIAVEVLGYLIALHREDIELCVCCNKTETGSNGSQKSLRWFANKWGIREVSLNEVYPEKNLIFLSMEFDRILKTKKFCSKELYNIHFSLLPAYKGVYTSAMPLINGEKISGVTLHRINDGIDTGEIIDQRCFEIDSEMNAQELYQTYIENGIELVTKNLNAVIDGMVSSRPQSASGSSYYSKQSIDYSNLSIDLNQTAEKIKNTLRGFSFRQYQMPRVHGKEIIDSYITGIKSSMKPGAVVFSNTEGELIATIDYDIFLYYDRFHQLMKACEAGKIEVVREICCVKKHINQSNEKGWRPITVAVYNGHEDIVEFLIGQGADIKIVNNNGTNLLMYAKDAYFAGRNKNLLKLFYDMNISPDEMDYKDKSLWDYVDENQATSVREQLGLF